MSGQWYNENMKKLHTFSLTELPLAGILKDFLAREGIECVLRNDKLLTAMGEIPFVECYPELWLLDEECLPRARMLLDGWLQSSGPASAGRNWTCACGEVSEGQFGACWSCGRLREDG